jgi:hypothetical protein
MKKRIGQIKMLRFPKRKVIALKSAARSTSNLNLRKVSIRCSMSSLWSSASLSNVRSIALVRAPSYKKRSSKSLTNPLMIGRSLKEIAFRAPHLKRVLWRRKTRPTTKKSTTPKGPRYKRLSPNQTKLSKRFVRLSHSLSRRWDLFHQGSKTYRLSL